MKNPDRDETRQLEECIVERHVTEEALRESEEKYRTLFSSMGEGFALHEMIYDEAGKPVDYRFLEINDAFERQTGLKREDLIGKTVLEVMPSLEPWWIETYGKVASTGEPAKFENYSIPLDRWYEVYAFSPAPGRFAAIFADVTVRKKAEQALSEAREELEAVNEEMAAQNEELRAEMDQRREVEEALRMARNELETRVQERTRDLEEASELARAERQRFYDVLETLPAYLVLLTPDYHVPFANRFFRERFGESGGRRCYEYLFERTEPCEICDTYTVLKTNAPHRWEWTGPDGRIYDIYDFPFTDSDGSSMIMEMGIDITERRHAEAELAKHRDRLEDLVQERTGELEKANAQLHSEIVERMEAEEELRAAYQRERHIAQVLQKAIAPPETLVGEGYRVASVYIPAFAGEEVGGDFYDVFRLSDGRLGILIGDVSGKGVEAAAQAALTRSTIRALAFNMTSPSEVLASANSVLYTQQPAGAFVTMFLAALDAEAGRICYSSAGHPAPAVLRTDGRVEFLEGSDLPIGVLNNHEFVQAEANLFPGDEIVLYTDGISEARRDGLLFDVEGIESVLRRHPGAEPADLVERLLEAAKSWAEGILRDDTALVVIQRKP